MLYLRKGYTMNYLYLCTKLALLSLAHFFIVLPSAFFIHSLYLLSTYESDSMAVVAYSIISFVAIPFIFAVANSLSKYLSMK